VTEYTPRAEDGDETRSITSAHTDRAPDLIEVHRIGMPRVLYSGIALLVAVNWMND
jgi:hypothetical protein